jgi:hypothetical protein
MDPKGIDGAQQFKDENFSAFQSLRRGAGQQIYEIPQPVNSAKAVSTAIIPSEMYCF